MKPYSKKYLTLALAGVLAASMPVSAFAHEGKEPTEPKTQTEQPATPKTEETIPTKTEAEKTNYTIIDYIQKNYGNCNLNLSYMCRELKISEQAMSKFFQELGCSFSAILEKVRIEAACEMLSDKSLTIKAISEKVGYSSDVSFRRAFKRVLGISPSEFIKKNSIQSE